MAVTFKQTELENVGVGHVVFAETPPFKKYKTVFVCPYENSGQCPKIERYCEDNLYFYYSCNKSPVVQKSDGSSICKVVIDTNDPNIEKSLASLGDYLEFRSMKK